MCHSVNNHDTPSGAFESDLCIVARLENLFCSRGFFFCSDICLLNQQFVKNDQFTVTQMLQDLIAKTGESIKIRRFSRFEIGA